MSNKKAIELVEEVKEEVIEEVIEKPYTLRKLKDADLFPLLKIFRKIGVSNFKEAFVQIATGEKSLHDLGIMVIIDMVGILVDNIGSAETEIYDLWSDISGIPVDEIKEMEFGTLPMMIFDTFTEVKDLSFFKVLVKLL